jgi:hypothetical protein
LRIVPSFKCFASSTLYRPYSFKMSFLFDKAHLGREFPREI